MSALLRVERLEIPQWGRASGFDLDLSAGNFLVLFGPNESGKSSVATALAWLIAGPGKQGVLQHFGSSDDRLRARLQGILGSDRLVIDVSAKVTAQRSGASARETLEATIGGSSIGREQLTNRVGGGDFSGYQRLYWVEALRVADGTDLHENVSVQAMFGGVNPFAEADSLSDKALELLGASRGRARSGSTRDLHDQVRAIEAELRALPDTKREWSHIEQELAVKSGRLEELRRRIGEIEGELDSVSLASDALGNGLVADRDAARRTLATTPEPSAADRRVREQATLVSRKVGELTAAEEKRDSAQEQHETSIAVLDGDWQQLVPGVALGEAGIDDAADAERKLKIHLQDLATAAGAEVGAQTRHSSWTNRYSELANEWECAAPESLTPEMCVRSPRNLVDADRPAGRTTIVGTPRAGRRLLGRRRESAPFVVGAACVVAVAAIAAAAGNWTATVVGGVGAVLLLVAGLVRSARRPFLADDLDPGLVALAERLLKAQLERDSAHQELTTKQRELVQQQMRADNARSEYQQKLASCGVPEHLMERFEQSVTRHLRAVRDVQTSGAALDRDQDAVSARLEEVRQLLTEVEPDAAVPASPDRPDPEDGATNWEAQAGGASEAGSPREIWTGPTRLDSAAAAEFAFDAACERVDAYERALGAVEAAGTALTRALRYDEAALALISGCPPEELRARQGALQSERDGLIARRDKIQPEIDQLRADRTVIEAPNDQRVDLVLQRSELLAQVEDGLVRGLGHHLAAQLLQEAAEHHRQTQQPELLLRTQELAGEVADDWLSVTVNPHASTAAGTSGRSDALLVDSPRGEYAAQRLSFGAQSLLYLMLRLATIEDQSKARGVRLPLILDDVLVGLDDERAQRCVQVLAEFSANHQVLLLTCHERTAERAQSAGAQIVEIPPR